jgi:hypothetical protein
MDAISTGRVITLLADHILERDQSVRHKKCFFLKCFLFVFIYQKLSDEDRVNYEQNVQDALIVLDKLKTGLDVNLKFDG